MLEARVYEQSKVILYIQLEFLFRNVAEDEPRVWTDLVQIVHLPSNRTKWSDNLFPGVTLITILLREKT